MYKFRYIDATNLVTYKKLHLDINPGLYVVRGENRSGKSILFSSIANVLYFSPPMERRKNKARSLISSNTRITIGIERNGDLFHIEQKGHGKSGTQYKIYEGKGKKNIHTRGAKEKIRTIYPLVEDFFYNQVYIHGLRSSVLQIGTAAQRFDFFERIFNMEMYDEIRKELSKELYALKEKSLKADVYKKELAELKDISKEEFQSKIKEFKQNKIEYKKEKKKLDSLYKRLERVRSIKNWKSKLRYSLGHDKTKDKHTELSSIIAKIEKRQASIKKNIDLYEQQSKFWKIKNKLIKNKKKLVKLIGDNKKIDIKQLENELSKYEDYYEQAQRAEEIKNDSSYKLGLKYDVKKNYKKIEKKKRKLQTKIDIAVNTVNRISRITGKNKCPLCGQGLDKKHISGLLDEANKVIGQKDKIKDYDKLLSSKVLIDEYDSLKFIDLDKAEKKIKLIEHRIKKARLINSYIERLESVDKNLIRLKNIDKPKSNIKKLKKELIKHRKELSEFKTEYDHIDSDKKIYEFLSSAKKKDLNADYDQLNKKYKIRFKKSEKKTSEINSQALELRLIKESFKNRKRLEKKIKELDSYTKDIVIYENLIKAYGPKGLRILRIQSLAKLFENKLNEYSPLIFPEPFVFEINVGPNKFDIMAQRSGKTGDVMMLSGSESRCFQALSLLSIMSFLPKNLRSNMVVLDELEANMDEKSRGLYIDSFLPKLTSIIETIIIVTPLSSKEFFIDNVTKNYLIEKVNGVSVIKEGTR